MHRDQQRQEERYDKGDAQGVEYHRCGEKVHPPVEKARHGGGYCSCGHDARDKSRKGEGRGEGVEQGKGEEADQDICCKDFYMGEGQTLPVKAGIQEGKKQQAHQGIADEGREDMTLREEEAQGDDGEEGEGSEQGICCLFYRRDAEPRREDKFIKSPPRPCDFFLKAIIQLFAKG